MAPAGASCAELDANATSESPSGVRFATDVQEIEPAKAVHDMTVPAGQDGKEYEDLTPQAKEEIKSLAMTLQKSRLQETRMANFTYEPISLPASRVSSLREPTETYTMCFDEVLLQKLLTCAPSRCIREKVVRLAHLVMAQFARLDTKGRCRRRYIRLL